MFPIGRARRSNPANFPVQQPITRSVTRAHNNLISETAMSATSSTPSNQRLERLDSEMQEIRELFASMSSKFDQLLEDRSQNLGSGSHNRNGGPQIHQSNSGTSGSTAPKIAKLDFTRYSGDEDPTSWICLVEQFFDFHGTSPVERLSLAA
jgi:hypothetical protein